MSQIRSWNARDLSLGLAMALALLAMAGCSHKTRNQPPPAATAPAYPPANYPTSASVPSGPSTGRIPVTRVPEGGVSPEDKDFILSHRPMFSQEGEATWYTTPHKGRKAANGQVFSDDGLTAAHRTLPMGSLIVVTNLVTRQASAMRISDRGPFVPNKILDLSIASAKSIGIYRTGTARVRIDVYQSPKPIEIGGRWCVQIGPFRSERTALRFKEKLLSDYDGSHVIEFPAENSYWVRIRPEGDDRAQAELIARRLRPDEGTAYLTRLD